MNLQRINTQPDIYEPFLLSQGIQVGDFLFISGQAGYDDNGQIVKGGFRAQGEQAFANLERVLVTGGAGAVGFYAVQFAKWGGASMVIATVSSPEQAEVVLAAGADYSIDYKKEDVAARVKELTSGAGVDRIYDVAFGANLETSDAVIKPNGVISTYSSDVVPEPKLPFWSLLAKDITLHIMSVYDMPESAHQSAIDDITACLKSGVLQHKIAHRFPLEEVAAAHELVENGNKLGKVLVDIN